MFLIFAVCVVVAVTAHAQDQLRSQLFGEADGLLNQAKAKLAQILSPESFKRGMEHYTAANEAFQKGRSPEDIRERLKNAEAYFSKALDVCKLAEVTFSTTMGARRDAQSADASSSYPLLWKEAEEEFLEAARDLEEGDVTDARTGASRAEAMYRNAELEAIKSNFLAPARNLILRAEEIDAARYAPRTIARAKLLASQVETLLKQNRYDTDEARALAVEARYEAAHAMYLAIAINKLSKSDGTLEDVMLSVESQVQRIASVTGTAARFENGFDTPVQEIIAAIKDRDNRLGRNAESLASLAESLRVKELEIDNLKKQTSSMEHRLGSLNETERTLQQQLSDQYKLLATQRQQEGTVRRVAGMFTEDEGKVLREGENVIIRLCGLSFPVGKNTIESQYYPLLTRVQEAIRAFPNCRVVIEGHTDSQGGDEANQILSASRARAVAEYLMANMNAELAINHEGYGESRPVASNDIPEGRARNRRIDVVITPGWTTIGR
jgi:outer membrane protein OmpA-like peptidoglycan-associated protein